MSEFGKRLLNFGRSRRPTAEYLAIAALADTRGLVADILVAMQPRPAPAAARNCLRLPHREHMARLLLQRKERFPDGRSTSWSRDGGIVR